MKKYKSYILTSIVVFLIFLIVFLKKGIFPFGDYGIQTGDLENQITSFFYHFYDCFHNGKSLLINYSMNGGIDFFSHIAYYLMSPFSFIVLLFDRVDVYKSISIILFFKMLTSSLTMNYFIEKNFKNISIPLKLLLNISYAFCGFTMLNYQIVGWLDIVYMFPLVMAGLKNMLDMKDYKLYVVSLALTLIFNFYLGFMVLIFVFIFSMIYLCLFNRKNLKKLILRLGIYTILGIGISAVVLIPSMFQIFNSSRITLNLQAVFNTKFGKVYDKLHFILNSGVLLGFAISFVVFFRKRKKELLFFIFVMLILLLPLFVEPINLLWHFGSYYCFTVRFSFIITFMFIYFACMYINEQKKLEEKQSFNTIILVDLIIGLAILIYIYIKIHNRMALSILYLTIGIDLDLFKFLLGMFLVVAVFTFIILKCEKNVKFRDMYLLIIVTIICFFSLYNYVGMEVNFDYTKNKYKNYFDISSVYDDAEFYKLRLDTKTKFNYGDVTNYNSDFSFSSLNSASSNTVRKLLGYSNHPNINYSNNGNLFTDALLGNKYMISTSKMEKRYYNLKEIKGFNNYSLYKLKYDIPFGYLMNDNFEYTNDDSTFEIQNRFYKNITGADKDLFKIVEVDKRSGIFEYTVDVPYQKSIYLEVFDNFQYRDNKKIHGLVDIYINGQLREKQFPDVGNNGIINLGLTKGNKVKIKLHFNFISKTKKINIGIMNQELLEKFLTKNDNISITSEKNKLNINVTTDKNKFLFLPISYLEGMSATINGKKVDIEPVLDNYIGINLKDSENNIKITYIPKYLIPSLIISIGSLIVFIANIKYKFIEKLESNNITTKIVSIIYKIMYIIVLLALYLIPFILFIVSFFKYVKL